MISSYKLILFDAGGTLLHPYPSVGQIYSDVARKFGCEISVDELNQRFRVVWKKHDGLETLVSHSDEKIERDWWKNIVTDVFSHVKDFERFDDFFDELYDFFARPECWRLYPEVKDVLETIKARNQPMGIVSNWDSRLHRLCDELQLTPYFDFILASAVVGASKPSKKIFELALSHHNFEPHEVIHIGDSVGDDVRGALQSGVDVVLIDRHDEVASHPVLEEKSVRKVTHLGELVR